MRDNLTLLTFILDPVWYGLNVQEVQEVVPLPELTPLAEAPPFVSGIFNLRGRIVTAIDLRRRLGLEPRSWNAKNAVLIIPLEEKLYGLIVDEALSLIPLANQDMEPAPDLSPLMGNAQGRFFLGVKKMDGRLIPILNLKRIFTAVELEEPYDRQVKQSHE